MTLTGVHCENLCFLMHKYSQSVKSIPVVRAHDLLLNDDRNVFYESLHSSPSAVPLDTNLPFDVFDLGKRWCRFHITAYGAFLQQIAAGEIALQDRCQKPGKSEIQSDLQLLQRWERMISAAQMSSCFGNICAL